MLGANYRRFLENLALSTPIRIETERPMVTPSASSILSFVFRPPLAENPPGFLPAASTRGFLPYDTAGPFLRMAFFLHGATKHHPYLSKPWSIMFTMRSATWVARTVSLHMGTNPIIA